MTLNGIDVSHAGQGAGFPWASYKGKVQFAFTKVSEGLAYADPDAGRNLAQMRAAGLHAGGYHFLHAGLSGSAQAEWFLARAHAAGLKPGDLIMVDCEDLGLDGEGYAQMNLTALAFAGELRRHFPVFWPVVYTEISMAPSLPGLGNCPLFLANPSGMAVKSIGPWKGGPSFEQVSQRGVDCDVFYGDAGQLAKLAFR
jgi:lysozyme